MQIGKNSWLRSLIALLVSATLSSMLGCASGPPGPSLARRGSGNSQLLGRNSVPARGARAAAAPMALAQAPAYTEYEVRPVGHTTPISGAMPPTALPPNAWTGGPAMPDGGWGPGACPPGTEFAGPDGQGYWQPDGLQGPWPYDEYIWDGGDRDVPVKVDPDATVRGIDQEDTIAHFDTLKGKTEVVPSNRVPIYAPRFAAVRKVYGLEYHEGHERVAGTENPVRLNSQEATRIATTAIQPVPPVLQHNFRTSVALLDRTRGIGVDNSQQLAGLDNRFLPYEDFLLIRRGLYEGTEKARLAERMQAALAWTTDQSVQVVVDGDPASEAVNSTNIQETKEYHMPPGKPRLRICKVASKSEALPNEEIDFTLRFDNVGDQPINNVVIIDSLTTRLEYVDGSAQCSLKGRFGTQVNEAESLLLRWEITDPLPVGQGGIIRFKCRVR